MAIYPRARTVRYAARGRRPDAELSPAGFGLHWEELDLDFTVAGLLAGRFGTDRYMRERFDDASHAEAAE
jgi:hypothetical protein